jgi:hypothetical protein
VSQKRKSHACPSRLASRYAAATRSDCRSRILDKRVPWSSDTLPVVCPVVTAPTSRASMTATDRPAFASNKAVVSPVSPAPTTTSS